MKGAKMMEFNLAIIKFMTIHIQTLKILDFIGLWLHKIFSHFRLSPLVSRRISYFGAFRLSPLVSRFLKSISSQP